MAQDLARQGRLYNSAFNDSLVRRFCGQYLIIRLFDTIN